MCAHACVCACLRMSLRVSVHVHVCICLCVYAILHSNVRRCYRVQYHAWALVVCLCSHDCEQNCFPIKHVNSLSSTGNEASFSYSTSSIGNCHYINVETEKYQDQNSIVFGDNINGEPNPIKVDVNVWQVRDQCKLYICRA